MTRTEAAHSVRNRWERLGIGTPEEFPHVFSSDVENMMASTGNILDVADGADAIKASVESVGDEGVCGTVEGHGTWRPVVGTCALELSGNGMETLNPYPEQNATARSAKPTSEYQASLADSQILDCHGDDRFADNILRALEGLPQNGDAEEEEAAAEEGALIEASGYNDPATNPRFA